MLTENLSSELTHFVNKRPEIRLVILFGSVAKHTERFDSDIDLAVDIGHVMDTVEKTLLIENVASITGRAVDLIDLRTVGQPLFGQVLRYGKRLKGDDSAYGALLSQFLLDQADFAPYRQRILAERRQAWIGF